MSGLMFNFLMFGLLIVFVLALIGLMFFKRQRDEYTAIQDNEPKEKTDTVKMTKGEKTALNKGFNYNVSENNKIKPGKYVVRGKAFSGIMKNDSILELQKNQPFSLSEGDKFSSKDYKITIEEVQ